ncbi:MAG: NUDIX domain-containing protein [Firmicutes bacterium]|nr:NUDIX domain-containing protein [Bacillota bacterium]
MISFSQGGTLFNYRVAGVAYRDDGLGGRRVLLHRSAKDDFWCLPGGRCELLEASREAVRREMREEIGVEVEVGRLLWVVEAFFADPEGKNPCHELCFYYRIELPADFLRTAGETFGGRDGDLELLFRWFSVRDVPELNLVPPFLRERLPAPPGSVEHIVSRDL